VGLGSWRTVRSLMMATDEFWWPVVLFMGFGSFVLH
jgi:hypothetical protein